MLKITDLSLLVRNLQSTELENVAGGVLVGGGNTETAVIYWPDIQISTPKIDVLPIVIRRPVFDP